MVASASILCAAERGVVAVKSLRRSSKPVASDPESLSAGVIYVFAGPPSPSNTHRRYQPLLPSAPRYRSDAFKVRRGLVIGQIVYLYVCAANYCIQDMTSGDELTPNYISSLALKSKL